MVLSNNLWKMIPLSFYLLILLFVGLIFFCFPVAIRFFSITDFFSDDYIVDVFIFNFIQSLCCCVISIALGGILANSLYKQKNRIIQAIFGIPFMLSSIIVGMCMIYVYGPFGVLSKICSYFGCNVKWNFSGFYAILFCHCVLNVPLVARIMMNAFLKVSPDLERVMMQNKVSFFYKFLVLRWPFVKQVLPHCFCFIFILCFTSFTIPQILASSTKQITTEFLIYQYAFFENAKSYVILVMQFFICFGLIFCLFKNKQNQYLFEFKSIHRLDVNHKSNFFDFLILVFFGLIYVLPFLSIMTGFKMVYIPGLFSATVYSIWIGFLSFIICMVIALPILYYKRKKFACKSSYNFSFFYVLLSISPMSLAYLLNAILSFYVEAKILILIVTYSICLFPWAIFILSSAAFNFDHDYENISKSYGVFGIKKFFIVDFHLIKNEFFMIMFVFLGYVLCDIPITRALAIESNMLLSSIIDLHCFQQNFDHVIFLLVYVMVIIFVIYYIIGVVRRGRNARTAKHKI